MNKTYILFENFYLAESSTSRKCRLSDFPIQVSRDEHTLSLQVTYFIDRLTEILIFLRNKI